MGPTGDMDTMCVMGQIGKRAGSIAGEGEGSRKPSSELVGNTTGQGAESGVAD